MTSTTLALNVKPKLPSGCSVSDIGIDINAEGVTNLQGVS